MTAERAVPLQIKTERSRPWPHREHRGSQACRCSSHPTAECGTKIEAATGSVGLGRSGNWTQPRHAPSRSDRSAARARCAARVAPVDQLEPWRGHGDVGGGVLIWVDKLVLVAASLHGFHFGGHCRGRGDATRPARIPKDDTLAERNFTSLDVRQVGMPWQLARRYAGKP